MELNKYSIGSCMFLDAGEKREDKPICLTCSRNPNKNSSGDCGHEVGKDGLVRDWLNPERFALVLSCQGYSGPRKFKN